MNLRDAATFRRKSCALVCALALSVCPPGAIPAEPAGQLPSLGDAVSEDVDVSSERRLGDQIMHDIYRDPDYIDDPVLLEYLQSLWQPLLKAARAAGDIDTEIDQRFAWEPFLVRDRSVNAFALPGGFVGVHLGLMAMTSTRDELASVLAHEISHVTQRHIARGISHSRRQSIMSMAALIIGVLAASRSEQSDGAHAVVSGGQALAIQGQLNFSRDMEREADRIGFVLMSNAGFAPGGMAAMFEKLEHNARLNDGGGFPYLRSHPLTTERIGEARARLGANRAATPASLLVHVAAQARARVLMDPRAVMLRRWQSQTIDPLAPVEEQLLAAYSSALASSLLRDWKRADESLQWALNLVRTGPRSDAQAERAVVLLAAQSSIERGDLTRAAQWLKPYQDSLASSRAVMLLQAQWALVGKDELQLKQSADTLQTWAHLHPRDASAWLALSQAWRTLGHTLRALRAEAEAHVATGDFTGAVDRLREGQRQARAGGKLDFIEASVIDARMRAVEIERRKQRDERAKD